MHWIAPSAIRRFIGKIDQLCNEKDCIVLASKVPTTITRYKPSKALAETDSTVISPDNFTYVFSNNIKRLQRRDPNHRRIIFSSICTFKVHSAHQSKKVRYDSFPQAGTASKMMEVLG